MSDTRVVLLGVGAIGRELLRQLAVNRRSSARGIRICGLIDRSGFAFDPEGFTWRTVLELRAHKASGRSLATAPQGQAATTDEAIARITGHGLSRPVLIDVTAADTAPWLIRALTCGFDVVLANKVPLAGGQEEFDGLRETAAAHGRRILHEATVGAGLPVIDTIRKLQEAGDRILTIEGCPSGTLGFLFGRIAGPDGCRFSAALHEAVAAGYSEPDPRVDLSGLDVARKALILARGLGFRGDLSDIPVDSLVPAALRTTTKDEFLGRIADEDVVWDVRASAAHARGSSLRYRIRVTRRSVQVGLAEVPFGDPLSGLRGTDNQFAFTTTRYREQPLVITGPGAGPAVTASGVYNDLLALRERRGSSRARRSVSPFTRSPRARQV